VGARETRSCREIGAALEGLWAAAARAGRGNRLGSRVDLAACLVEHRRAAESAAAPREETPRKTWARLRRRLRQWRAPTASWRHGRSRAGRCCRCAALMQQQPPD
jgi:hypothetical protein